MHSLTMYDVNNYDYSHNFRVMSVCEK